MESKKHSLPTEIDVNDLIDLIGQEGESVDRFENDVVRFLSFFNIRNGKQRVPVRLLESLYFKWSQAPVTKSQLRWHLNQYLVIHRTTKYFALINIDALDLSKAAYEVLRKEVRDKAKIPNYKRHFDAFLNHYGIEPGTTWMEHGVLYYLYDKWTYKRKNRNPLGKQQFFNLCKMYFQSKQRLSESIMWFQINDAIFEHLTKTEIAQVKKGCKRQYERKKHAQRARQVSRSNPRV